MQNNISFRGLPKNTRYVSEKLIVGARQGLFGLRKLQKEEGVNLVIDFSSKKNFPFPLIEILLCKLLKLKHKLIPINLVKKNYPLKEAFEKAKKTISENKDTKIFVHCRSGKHRSVLVAAVLEVFNNRIKTMAGFEEFLKKNHFYDVKYVRKCLIRFKPTAEEIKIRIDRLNFQKQRLIDLLFERK